MTTEYGSYREALSYFLRVCAVENAKMHFPDELDPQQRMFDEEDHRG